MADVGEVRYKAVVDNSGIDTEIKKTEKCLGGLDDPIKKTSSKFSGLGKVGVTALKGIGTASKAVGKFVGSIPLVKEGRIDEFLQDSGKHIKSNAKEIEMTAITAFAEISNPETRVFIDKMEDMIQIYNHTEKICFDEKKIYLIAG